MSKHFRPWKIDETHLLPPSIQDYVAEDHLSRLLRGIDKVKPEWALICTAHNLGKLARAN
jgi:hypothetical protein